MARHMDQEWFDSDFTQQGCHEHAAVHAVCLSVVDRLVDQADVLASTKSASATELVILL